MVLTHIRIDGSINDMSNWTIKIFSKPNINQSFGLVGSCRTINKEASCVYYASATLVMLSTKFNDNTHTKRQFPCLFHLIRKINVGTNYEADTQRLLILLRENNAQLKELTLECPISAPSSTITRILAEM